MDLLKKLQNNPFVLAPMAGITDLAFRSYMRNMGCGIVITELVSANGLKYGSERTRKLMQFEELQRPVGIQIFGEDLGNLGDAAKEVEHMGADFVDLNLGCPVPKVVKKGAGSALLKNLPQLKKILRYLKSSVDIPVTIKIRTGWDQENRNANQVCQLAYDEGITWVAIHGRTRSASYSGKADWDYIKQVKAFSKVPVLGNGDINSAATAVNRLNESQCDGVMIGRGCLKNPWIFKQAQALWLGQQQQNQQSFLEAIDLLKYYLEKYYEERMASLQMKKLSAWYSAGFPGSSHFRKNIFSLKEKSEVYKTAYDFFYQHRNYVQKDTSHENFLMGGHG